MSDSLPEIGTYWTSGGLKTVSPSGMIEAYSTCARCGAFVNLEERHEDWHRKFEATS